MKYPDTPMLISAFQFHAETSKLESNLKILNRKVVGCDFDTEQLLHICVDGDSLYTKSDAGFSYFNEDAYGEKLDQYLRESRKAGIREIMYWNIHTICPEDLEKHPEWPQVRRDGSLLRAYETEYYNCLNSSWREYFLGELAKLCHHDIDGVFLDGPVIPQGACFCPACQADYRRRYGKELLDANYSELMEYRVAVVTDFLKATREVMRRENPELFMYINNSALRADVTGSRTRALEDSVDLLGAEGGFVWVNRSTPLWPVTPMAKLIETQAEGRPTVIFIAGDYKPWSYYMHTAAETGMYYAQTVANGANVWYGIHGPLEQLDTPGGQEAVRWNRFLKKNRFLYADTHPAANVALLWSQDSANYYASRVERTDFTAAEEIDRASERPRGNHYDAFMGLFEILTRAHIQFRILDEEAVERGGLDGIDTAILPTYGCMRQSVAEKLRDFTRNGGTLISTFDSGYYDEKGNFRDVSAIADIEGIASLNAYTAYPLSGTGYRRMTMPSAVSEGLSYQYTPSADLALDAVPVSDVMVLAQLCTPMPGRYTSIPNTWYPSIWEHDFGKGKCIYFSEAIGEAYRKTTNPDQRRLLENAVRSASAPLVESDAVGSVEISLRKQNDGFVLHLINETGEMERPVSTLVPQYDIHITLHTGAPLNNAHAYTPDDCADVLITPTSDGAVLTVPKLASYLAISLS